MFERWIIDGYFRPYNMVATARLTGHQEGEPAKLSLSIEHTFWGQPKPEMVAEWGVFRSGYEESHQLEIGKSYLVFFLGPPRKYYAAVVEDPTPPLVEYVNAWSRLKTAPRDEVSSYVGAVLDTTVKYLADPGPTGQFARFFVVHQRLCRDGTEACDVRDALSPTQLQGVAEAIMDDRIDTRERTQLFRAMAAKLSNRVAVAIKLLEDRAVESRQHNASKPDDVDLDDILNVMSRDEQVAVADELERTHDPLFDYAAKIFRFRRAHGY